MPLLPALLLLALACRPAAGLPDGASVEPKPAIPEPAAEPASEPATDASSPPLALTTLAPGFELGSYRLPSASALGPGLVRFVRLDPARVSFQVGAASLVDGKLRTATEWGNTVEGPAVAVINASMFADDWLTSIGRLRVRGKVQRAAWASQQNSLFVTDPAVPGGPGAAILNLGCTDRAEADAAWSTTVQSIRMVGCGGENVWAQEARSWSSALVGADREGRLLFLHTRAPYTMHDLVDQLLAAPLDLVALHYSEGGPEASLHVRAPGVLLQEVGSYETGFVENDGNAEEWPLPNVLIAVAPAQK
jgi:hypothetical protein